MAFRQGGDIAGRVVNEDDAALVQPGHKYLAFVVRSFANDPARAHLWGALDGGVGLYVQQADGSFDRALSDGNPLPVKTTLEQVRQEIAS